MPGKKKKEPVSIGEKIKSLRLEKGLDLDQLANETGYSVENLKKIESGRNMPPVGILLQISRALEVESDFFLNEPKSTKKKLASDYAKRTKNYAYTTLSTGARHKHLKAFKIEIPAMKKHEGVGYRHEGEEFVYVLKGQVKITVGNHENILKVSDSLHFNSGIPHNMINTGKEDAELIVVLYSP